MKKFLQLDENRRKAILNQVSNLTGLTPAAIEKDWWVTLALKAIFTLTFSHHIIFKGGTSLSKGWKLIERFSEDIDLAIDREFLGFKGDLSRGEIRNLRKASCSFISGDFIGALDNRLKELEIGNYKLVIPEFHESDVDPLAIELHYESVTETVEYLPNRLLIETGARSLMEPTAQRPIQSFVGEYFADQDFSDSPELLSVVVPRKTFLEKAFLLHEEFQRPREKITMLRKSRHLYDLEKLMDTIHGKIALKNEDLYLLIVTHREKFFRLSGVDYLSHFPDEINFIPPTNLIPDLEKDYNTMRESMIYGDSLPFSELMDRIKELNRRFHDVT